VKGTRGVGARVEWRARLHYLLRGYRTLATNAWAGGNELDLVVRRGRSLVFCEVKGKTGRSHGDPLEMVGPEKQRRLRRAAEAWVDAHPAVADLEMTFEVMAERAGKLERVRAAF
jgi:putative endonuclease